MNNSNVSNQGDCVSDACEGLGIRALEGSSLQAGDLAGACLLDMKAQARLPSASTLKAKLKMFKTRVGKDKDQQSVSADVCPFDSPRPRFNDLHSGTLLLYF